ncbi:MAG: hypothetical protein HWE22_17505 [Flavobacteriales bacterium]|nr:hypothetical protein [Flavobacteriales bacterium]
MNIRLLLIFILITSESHAQWDYDSCPLDTNSELELSVAIEVVGGNQDSLLVYSFVTDRKGDNCEPFGFDWKTYTISSHSIDESFTCSPEQITKLRISLRDLYSSTYAFDLDTFEILNSLYLPQLKEFSIVGYPNFILHLNEWNMYEELVLNQTLSSIRFEGQAINEDWLNPFLKFEGLTEAQVGDNLSVHMEAFPNMERLAMGNIFYFFSYSILTLDRLKEIPSLYHTNDWKDWYPPANSNFRDSDFYPQISCLSSLLSPEIIGNPYHEINAYLNKELDSSFSGTLILTYEDVIEGYSYSNREDTLVIGSVQNGIPVNGWKYRIPNFQAFSGDGWYYYNYSDSAHPVAPENGSWKYYYPDSTLAISGQFKNGLKHGKWQFYNPDGFLATVQNYELGFPKGLFISYQKFDGEIIESRRYFHTPRNFTFSIRDNDGMYVMGSGNPFFHSGGYNISTTGVLYRRDNEYEVHEVPKESREYKKVLKKYLKLLYPESKISLKEAKLLGQ